MQITNPPVITQICTSRYCPKKWFEKRYIYIATKVRKNNLFTMLPIFLGISAVHLIHLFRTVRYDIKDKTFIYVHARNLQNWLYLNWIKNCNVDFHIKRFCCLRVRILRFCYTPDRSWFSRIALNGKNVLDYCMVLSNFLINHGKFDKLQTC